MGWLTRVLLGGLLLFEIIGLVRGTANSDELIWPGLIATNVFVWVVLEGVDRYLQRHKSTPLPLMTHVVAVSVVYLDAVGNILDWYSRYVRFDELVHFSSGIAGAVLFLPFFRRLFVIRQAPLGFWWAAYVGLVTTSLLAIFFEVGEYFGDQLWETNYWLGDGVDTVSDLSLNVMGAVVGVLLLYVASGTSKRVISN